MSFSSSCHLSHFSFLWILLILLRINHKFHLMLSLINCLEPVIKLNYRWLELVHIIKLNDIWCLVKLNRLSHKFWLIFVSKACWLNLWLLLINISTHTIGAWSRFFWSSKRFFRILWWSPHGSPRWLSWFLLFRRSLLLSLSNFLLHCSMMCIYILILLFCCHSKHALLFHSNRHIMHILRLEYLLRSCIRWVCMCSHCCCCLERMSISIIVWLLNGSDLCLSLPGRDTASPYLFICILYLHNWLSFVLIFKWIDLIIIIQLVWVKLLSLIVEIYLVHVLYVKIIVDELSLLKYNLVLSMILLKQLLLWRLIYCIQIIWQFLGAWSIFLHVNFWIIVNCGRCFLF